MHRKDELTTLREQAKAIRQAAGLSQADVAIRVGCSESTIWGIESGRSNPSLRLAIQLAKALEVSLDRLTRGDQ